MSQWCGVCLMHTRYCGCSLEEEYSLGFKEGVMWMDALYEELNAGRWSPDVSRDAYEFFFLWWTSMREGR